MNRCHWFALFAVLAALAVVGSERNMSSPLAAAQDGPPVVAKVYVHPQKLTAKDKLSFGPSEEQKKTIPIKGEATLVYVDLMPNARFAHPTQCILISTDGAPRINAAWRPILN